jgi:hypothetical protein
MPKKRGPYRVRRHPVIQPLDPSYRIISLTKKQNTKVSFRDFSWLSQWNWFAQWSKNTNSFYAVRNSEKDKNGKQHNIRMSREILGCGPNEEADHRNHDTLDNRRENLRKATRNENVRNRRLRKDSTSGYIGVSWQTLVKQWVARISYDGVETIIGYYPCPKEAARAYNCAAKSLHGEFASLNHIND